MKSKFTMPPTGTWEQRGGWVVTQLTKDVKVQDFQSAGIVGNLGYESGEFKKLHEEGLPFEQGGIGWAQWTGTRRRKYETWCTKNKLNWQSDEANYGFLVAELKSAYKSFLTELQQTTTLAEATHKTHANYETPSDALDGSFRSAPERLEYAKRALQGSSGVDPIPPANADLDNALLAQAAITRIIQQNLNLTVDGDYGPGTRKAVLDYLKGK